MFEGRRIAIATKHHKEKVIAPILERELGVRSIVPNAIDTDVFGTFSGEIERSHDAITTARNKCLLAMELTNCDMAVASEGSFGQHPSIFFAPADDEILLFVDAKNKLEITVRELTTETNFSSAEMNSMQELHEFASQAQFPSHALIVRKSKDEQEEMIKGITNADQLSEVFTQFIEQQGKAFVETDMRAMYNPTRMKAIERAAIKLAARMNARCPNCETPGFGISDAKQGLPCENCHFPTRSTLSYVHSCEKCNHSIDQMYPHGKMVENPMYCDHCNP